MEPIILYQINSEDLSKFVKQEIVEKELDTFLNRFNNVFVSPEEVAKYHGVSKQTVYNHVKYGTLVAEFRENNNDALRFRLSDALRIDFKKLRKKININVQ